MAELHVHTPEGGKAVVPLGDAEVTFGRAADCDFVLAEQRASRRHCTFKPVGNGWRVVDEASSNGTYLGERPVLSARLQPGDELEIGQTIIEYVADVEETASPPRRPPRVSREKPGWGRLAIPLVFGVGAYLGVGLVNDNGVETRRIRWEQYARTVVQRADLPTQAEGRQAELTRALARLPDAREANRARRILTAAQETGAAVARRDEAWREAVTELRVKWLTTSAAERRGRIADLLDRHAHNQEAAAELRPLLDRMAKERTVNAAEDRARVFAEGQRAQDDGRLGDALDAWNAWLFRAPTVSGDDERDLSRRFDRITRQAEEEAELALDRAESILGEGRRTAAREFFESAVARLHGTGWDAWLEARAPQFAEPTGVPVLDIAPVARGSATTRERTYALRALAAAEELARLRQFDDAAERLQAAQTKIGDRELRSDLEDRLLDLRAEATLLARVVAQVAENPRAFSPLRLADGAYTVNGATMGALVLERRGKPESRAVAELPTEALVQLCARAQLTEDELVHAALLLWDIGELDAYTAMMRRALAVEDDEKRLTASLSHARLHGRPLPDGGYVPHPEADDQIITWEDYRAIQNAAKIVEYTAELTKVVEKLESTKQAKSVRRVAAAHAKLEAARKHALELIFDEEKYFYPYRNTGREAEYAKASHEVDERVKAVRKEWASKTKTHPKSDAQIEALMDEAEDLRIEIEFLAGDIDELVARVERVTMYLGHELTVQTFFENTADLDLHEYNARVMAGNKVVESVAEDSERRQVEVTNEYRMMMGHRRAVAVQDQLTLAARGHSDDMGRLGFFDHFSPVPGKRAPADRMRAAGYAMMGGSENIHRGSGSPEGAHASWIHSSGHHRNILMKSWTEMGTGRSGNIWTQNFGFRDTDPY